MEATTIYFEKAGPANSGETLNAGFLQKNCPVYDSEGANFIRVWGQYEDKRPEMLFMQAFSAVFKKLLPV